MEQKKAIYLISFIGLIVIIGILPVFLPISIMDDSYENWNGRDLTENVIGDNLYYNDTYLNLSPPTNLTVFDLRGFDYQHQLLLVTLQGLVNRDNVSLFLIFRSNDLFWLQQLNESRNINNYKLVNDDDYWNLIDSYKDNISGLIVYDEDLLDTVNIGTYLGGVYNCVVIQEDFLSNFTLLGINTVKFDLRDQFSDKIDCYTWAWTNYGQFATKKMACSCAPTQVLVRDYIVAAKIFTFYLAVGPLGPVDEINLLKQILSEYPENIPVIGWFYDPAGALGEYEAVKIISKQGKYCLCANVPDLTVLSAIDPGNISQQEDTFDASSYTIENKVYVSVIVSDGDNVNFCAEHLRNLWGSSDRGIVPVGISLEPAMFKIFPNCLKYYYESATSNTAFVAGPSGAGYCYVDLNPAFPKYLNQTVYAMEQADMQQVWLLNGYEGYQMQYSKEVVDAYTSSKFNISALYLNYHEYPSELNYLSNNKPVFQSIFVERENELVGKLQALKSTKLNSPVFVFVGFWAWDFTFTKLKNAANQLGEDFVFMRPDHFSALFMESLYGSEERALNELLIFIGAGLIPLLGAVLGLLYLWKIKNKDEREGKEEGLGEEKSVEFLKSVSEKGFFLAVDIQLFLIMRSCLYSTILNNLFLVLFLVSIVLGIFLKKHLERAIGRKEVLIISIGLFSVGNIMFFISPVLIIFAGISIGLLLNHQIQSGSRLFPSYFSENKSQFFYLFIISSAVILLFLPEFYGVLSFLMLIISFLFSALCIYFLKDNQLGEISRMNDIRRWYPKAVIIGLLLYFLLSPTFFSERLYYYLVWGLEYYPTRLTIAFNIAALYLGAILLIEILKKKEINLSKKGTNLLLLISILSFIIIPLFLNGILIFILSTFIFIFGVLYYCTSFFDKSIEINLPQERDALKLSKKGDSGFIIHSLMWCLIGLFLFFIPPAIIFNDAQEIIAQLGVPAISELTWSPAFWWLLYTPSFQVFLIIPVVILIVILCLFEVFYLLLF